MTTPTRRFQDGTTVTIPRYLGDGKRITWEPGVIASAALNGSRRPGWVYEVRTTTSAPHTVTVANSMIRAGRTPA